MLKEWFSLVVALDINYREILQQLCHSNPSVPQSSKGVMTLCENR